MTDRLTNMITAQADLQRSLGFDYAKMTQDERIAYIKDNVLALTDEVHEALQETGWKPWATSRHVNEKEAFGELRDAWQFLTNLMLAVTGDDPAVLAARLEVALLEKLVINQQRIANNYDGVSSKCTGCRRDLAEISILEIHTVDGSKIERFTCESCNTVIAPEIAQRYITD